MKKPLLVFEDIQTTPRRVLFSFLGVEILATPYAWLSLPSFCLLGVFTAFLGEPEAPIVSRLVLGMELGISLFLTNAVHSLGHMLSGRFLDAPVGGILLTATRNVNVHVKDQSLLPKRSRILRALGGPLLNILVGVIGLGLCALFYQEWPSSHRMSTSVSEYGRCVRCRRWMVG